MGKSNKGILLVVVGGVALAIGFAAFYFLVLGPRAEKKRVQKEVSEWASRWEAARDCLVGPDPKSSDGLEAVLLREALAGPDVDMLEELRGCGEEVRGLRRGAGYTAGADVEAAWTELEQRIDKVVEAHALRTAKTPDRPGAELRVMLAEAVAALDLSYARLRERADMGGDHPDGDPLPTLPAGRVLADARGTPIAPDEVGVSGGVVWAIGTIGDRRWLVRHASAAAPEVIPLGVETVAGLDGTGWGLWVEDADEADAKSRAEVRAGALDALGDPSGDGAVVHALAAGEEGAVLAALGSGTTRVAFFQTTAADGTITSWLARSRDGGATWPERQQLLRGGFLEAQLDVAAQRLDLKWRTTAGAPGWLVIDRASIEAPLAAAPIEAPPGRPCVDGARTWWVGPTGELLYSPSSGTPVAPVPGSGEAGLLHACAGERLLALRVYDGELRDPTAFFCRATGCAQVVVPSVEGSRAAPLLGDKRGPRVAVDTDGVLVVWSGDPEKKDALAPATVARLAGKQRLAGIVEWAGALQLVTRTDEALHIVPLGGG
ncbi:MAG TPA: hypothetical protein VMZ28_09305 [Kofleriaceae bacterium]|nr:hypothetical protein [Kofleriaceae bacterium]